MFPTEIQLKNVIENIKEPIKFVGFGENIPGENNPEFLRWGPDKFIETLGDEVMSFRVGSNARTLEPQWDSKCPTEEMKMSEFLERIESKNDRKWRYFDYKYMHQCFEKNPEFLKLISWKRFGVDKTGNDSTIWIGSEGAHTNCHRDTYGCNLVAQLHGRKQWLLFPPETGNGIKPTRIPYEESTIYSKHNFFCPLEKEEEEIMKITEKPKLVILERGDVLLVPYGWWHYVESLDFSISINVWLPIDRDHKERIKEALVKFVVMNFRDKSSLFTEYEPEYTHGEAIELIKMCVDEYKKKESRSMDSSASKKLKETRWTAEELAREYPKSVKLLGDLSREELKELLTKNRKRFPEIENTNENSTVPSLDYFEILNAFCHNDITDKVSELLIKNK